jgi:hypothetical protein
MVYMLLLLLLLMMIVVAHCATLPAVRRVPGPQREHKP